MILFALSLMQAPVATVGDTIWVERVVAIAPRYLAQLPEWELEGDVELLGTPLLRRHGDSISLAFPLVAWRPGTHTLSVPGPRLIAPDGQVEEVPVSPRIITVGTVLPDTPKDSLPIRPEAGVIRRPTVSWLPMVLLLVVVAMIMAPSWWLWLRRGRAPPSEPPGAAPDPPLDRWIDAGERRTVLAAATGAVRDALATRLPEVHVRLETEACIAALVEAETTWDTGAVAELLQELDRARFAPEGSEDVLDLYHRARDRAQDLTGAASP